MKRLSQRFKKWAYPECEHLNNALRYLLKDAEKNKAAICEIYFAIVKTKGYFHEDVKKELYDEFKLGDF